jgi:tRNA-splicing endonuclease subunit Sen54
MITGGSSGIGYAIAERFLAEGASKVILVGRGREKLQDASRRLTESILEPASQTGDIATRTPEEDVGEKTTSSDPKVEVLVGDIAVANEWMSELEKAMVTFPTSFWVASY